MQVSTYRPPPYVAGNPVGGSSSFVGRLDILEDVLDTLRRPGANAVLLHGQRRIGKTSILWQLRANLEAIHGFRPVLFDLQQKASLPLDEVLKQFAAELGKVTDIDIQAPASDVPGWFRDKLLGTILAALPRNEALVLLFDEFDVLDAAQGPAHGAGADFFPFIGELLRRDLQRLNFVFVIGRNIKDLRYCKDLFKAVNARKVSMLAREDVERLIQLSVGPDALEWCDEAVDRVWEKTGGHPYLTQQTCATIWQSKMREPGERRVTASDIEAVLGKVLAISEPALDWIWSGLPPAGRVVASALAARGPQQIDVASLPVLLRESGVRVVLREFDDAPELLESWDLLTLDPARNTLTFRVELLREWIQKSRPLQTVLRELDKINPRADLYFSAAKRSYEEGDLKAAYEDLERALRVNPNHMGANLLRVDILLEQGDAETALELLEKIAEVRPSTARVQQIRALEMRLEAKNEESVQQTLLLRLRALEPDHPTFKRKWERMWVARGNRSFAARNFEAALTCFKEAGRLDFVEAVEAELRAEQLAAVKAKLAELVEEHRYSEALEVATTAALALGREALKADIASLQALELRESLYQRAMDAIRRGHRSQSVPLLAELIVADPRHRDAALRLCEIVYDFDIEKIRQDVMRLKQDLDSSERKRRSLEAERVVLLAELETMGEALIAERLARTR